MEIITIIVAGNNAVGKTDFIHKCLYGYTNENYEPTDLSKFEGGTSIKLPNGLQVWVVIYDVNGEIN